MPQNHISDLEQARELVKNGDYEATEMLYDDIPDTLSQLICTAFVPRNGMKFIVADFSAIEARVIAHLAGKNGELRFLKMVEVFIVHLHHRCLVFWLRRMV